MTSQTIRDVVIKVALESDTSTASQLFKNITNEAAVATKQVQSLQTQLKSIRNELVQQERLGIGTAGSQPQPISYQNIRSSIPSSLNGYQYSTSASPSVPVSILPSRLVDDRAERDRNRKNDQETENVKNSKPSLIQQTNDYKSAMGRAASQVGNLTKGLMLLTAASSENNDGLVKGIATVESWFNIIRGGIGTVNAITDAIRGYTVAANAASVTRGLGGRGTTGSSGVNAVKGVVEQVISKPVANRIPGAGGDSDAAPGTGVLPLLKSPIGLAAAGAMAAWATWRQTNIWKRDDEIHEAEERTSALAPMAQWKDAQAQLFLQHATQLQSRMPGKARDAYFARRSTTRGQTEARVRAEQQASNRDTGWMHEIRSRVEREEGLRDEWSGLNAQKLDIEGKQKVGAKVEADLRERRRQAVQAHASLMLGLNSRKRQSTGNSKVWAAMSGLESDADVRAHNAGINVEITNAKAAHTKNQAQLAEEEARWQEQQLQLGRERIDVAAQLLEKSREQVAAARQNYEADKASSEETHLRLGMMTPGMRSQAKRVSDKLLAGGQITTEYEKRIAMSALQGTKAGDIARKQLINAGAQSDIPLNVDVEGSKKKFEELDSNLKGREGGLLKEIEGFGKNNEQLADRLVKAIKGAFSLEEIVAQVEKKLLDAKDQHRADIRQANRVF